MANKKIYSIDVLRGLAVVLGVAFHASLIFSDKLNMLSVRGKFDIGHTRVDFFFVLSGFIISFIYGKYIGCQNRFKDYCMRRFLRVYPVYWVVLLPLVASILLFPWLVQEGHRQLGPILSSIFLVPAERDSYLIEPAWTLPYELLFYFVFAVAILNKRFGIQLALAWLCTIFVSHILKDVPSLIKFLGNWYNLEFFFGITLALLVKRISKPLKSVRPAIIIFSVGCLLLLFVFFKTNVITDNSFFTRVSVGISVSFIILGAVLYERFHRISYPKVLILLGDASYSIYLIHVPVLVVWCRLMKVPRLGSILSANISFLLAICVSVSFAVLFHLLIEKRILALSKKWYMTALGSELNSHEVA